MLLFADHVMLPQRTVSLSFPANHVHMPTALMNKHKVNSLANITWLELGNKHLKAKQKRSIVFGGLYNPV